MNLVVITSYYMAYGTSCVMYWICLWLLRVICIDYII